MLAVTEGSVNEKSRADVREEIKPKLSCEAEWAMLLINKNGVKALRIVVINPFA
jgi:hypothetical protein